MQLLGRTVNDSSKMISNLSLKRPDQLFFNTFPFNSRIHTAAVYSCQFCICVLIKKVTFTQFGYFELF